MYWPLFLTKICNMPVSYVWTARSVSNVNVLPLLTWNTYNFMVNLPEFFALASFSLSRPPCEKTNCTWTWSLINSEFVFFIIVKEVLVRGGATTYSEQWHKSIWYACVRCFLANKYSMIICKDNIVYFFTWFISKDLTKGKHGITFHINL